MAEDRLRMNYTPRVVFEGDCYGYVPYFSVVDINNVNGRFQPIDYKYDAKMNITSIKFLELLNTEFLEEDVEYSTSPDYGNVVKPTIKG